MTRENKLALVVGFALVLFVGILVSDHYSSVRASRGADLQNANANAQRPRERELRDLRGPREARATLASSTGTGDVGPLRPPVGSTPEGEPTSVTLGDRGVSLPRPEVPVSPHEIARRLPEPPSATAPAETTYVVKRGETLYSICEAVYGDAAMWKKVLELNGLKDARSLGAGATLRLPPTNQGEAPLPSENVLAGRGDTNELAVKFEQYTVREGDTLSDIARRLLGARGRWQELYDLNRDRVRNPDDVSPGTVLKVPASSTSKPSRVASARSA
jgi:nucleoid-associated protein YgaU